MINTIFFDLFGTLLKLKTDSKPYLKLAERGQKHSLRDSLQLSLVNNCNTLEDYASLIGLGMQKDINDLESQLSADLDNTELYDETLAVLEYFKAKNMKMVLISNLATPYKSVYKQFELNQYFNAAVFSCDIGYAKPNKCIFNHALNTVKSLPEEVIMVGDSYKSDVIGPSNAGIRGIHLRRECDGSPNDSIKSLSELCKIIV